MKNKKFTLAKMGIAFHFLLAIFFCFVMTKQVYAGTFDPRAWVGLMGALLISFNAILAAFGAANAIDKKTMIGADPESITNQS